MSVCELKDETDKAKTSVNLEKAPEDLSVIRENCEDDGSEASPQVVGSNKSETIEKTLDNDSSKR